MPPRNPNIRLVKDKSKLNYSNLYARDYIARGYAPIPIPPGAKGPTLKGWGKLEITEANVDEYFPTNERMNIGIILGARSNDLSDVDLDCREAVLLAPYFLPMTDAIFGRTGKQRSHWLYYIHDAVGQTKATETVKDEEGGVIVELRLGLGGRAAQTVFPGSVHPSGEEVDWNNDGDPADSTLGEAVTAVRRLGAAALLMRGWPTVPGSRHLCAFIVGAFLARAGLTMLEIEHMVKAVVQESSDNDINDRVSSALSSAQNTLNGEQTYGLPKMVEQFGEARANQISKLLDYNTVDQDETLERMNEKYCVVPIGDNVKMHVLTWQERGGRREAQFYRPDEFKTAVNNKKIGKSGAGTWWLNQPQRMQYDGIVFKPGEPKVINNELNLWQGWGIQPKEGNWSTMRDHMQMVLADGNTAMYEFILKFSAWTLQNPGTRPEVALVLRGIEGCGKGIYGRTMKDIFGRHGLHISDHEHLVGKFNKHLMDCALLFCDEAWWPGHKAAEGTIKRMLTEPTLLIEPKRVDSFEVNNCLHVIMAANADWVISASPNARRFAMANVAATRVGDKKYFRALYEEMNNNNGIAAMMNDLLAMKLEGWHPRENIPKNMALHEQQMYSLNPFDQFWFGLLCEGVVPQLNSRLQVPSRVLYAMAKESSPYLKSRSDHDLANRFKSKGAFCGPLGKYAKGICGVKLPPLKIARAEWSKLYPHVEWDEQEEWVKSEDVF